MAAILDAILDFEECQQGIFGDFLSVILHIFLDLSWKNQLVTKNVQVKTNIIGLLLMWPSKTFIKNHWPQFQVILRSF